MATGETGKIAMANGRLVVVMDNGRETWPYYQQDWRDLEVSSKRVQPMQRARVMYEVDRMLLDALTGGFGSTKPWDTVRDQERVKWRSSPTAHEGTKQKERQAVLDAVREVLRHEEDPEDHR
jgi:hypothetical protein